MSLRLLLPALIAGAAVFTHAQSAPETKLTSPPSVQRSKPDLTESKKIQPAITADDSIVLVEGTLRTVVQQVEKMLPHLQAQGDPKWTMPNLIYGPGTWDAVMPTQLRLRQVSPVQALALVAVAADCSLQAIFAPEETADQKPTIIGYRFELTKSDTAANSFQSSGSSMLGSAGEAAGGMTGATKTSEQIHGPRTAAGAPAPRPERPKYADMMAVGSSGPPGPTVIAIRPANSSENGSAADPSADGPVTRIYALRGILKGDDNETVVAQKRLTELVHQSIDEAGLHSEDRPVLSLHAASKALIVKATAAQHEIIQQAIAAMKENADADAAVRK